MPPILREKTCQHLDENMEQYIGFLLQQGSPEDELEFVSQYCWEIEQLKSDGYWSNIAGDFLPLALSNWSKRRVVIYTSKPEQPIIDIHPTVASSMIGTEVIPLAYTSAPGVSEHYDACRKMTALDPMSSDQNTGEGQILNSQDSNATSGDQINTSEPALNKTGTTDAQLRDIPSTNENVDEEPDFTAERLPVEEDTTVPPQSCNIDTPKKDHRQKSSTSYQTLTPRKTAKFVTPEKKRLTQKRKAATDSWKKNIRKKFMPVPRVGKRFQREMLSPHVRTADLNVYQCFQKRTERKYLIHSGTWDPTRDKKILFAPV